MGIRKNDDLDRLRREYSDRDRRYKGKNIYSIFNPAMQFELQNRQKVLLRLLRERGIESLGELRILELGCGSGAVLRQWISLGASIRSLHGSDLLFNRLEDAHNSLSCISLTCADGQNMPYKDGAFDLVLVYTVFSSVLDSNVRKRMAGECLRVLQDGGIIVWYDFWLNPKNPQTKGIKPSEIYELFKGCKINLTRTTLAPPLARKLVPNLWIVASFFESLRLLNTHYLATIQK